MDRETTNLIATIYCVCSLKTAASSRQIDATENSQNKGFDVAVCIKKIIRNMYYVCKRHIQNVVNHAQYLCMPNSAQ